MKTHFAILGAFGPELEGFKKLHAPGKEISTHEIGVGPFEAAARTAQILSELTEETPAQKLLLLFVGSVGCYDTSVPLLSLVSASQTSYADSALSNQQSYIPELQKNSFTPDKVYLEKIAAVPDVLIEHVLTTPSITSDESLAALFRETYTARFENLELASVAQAAQIYGVSWISLSAVTNYVGKDAHTQWRENFPAASKMTIASLAKLL